MLISAPILCYPKFNIHFIIRSDPCGYSVGGVLLQLYNNNIEHPIYFVGRSLKKYEKNYTTTEFEGTDTYYYLVQFDHYILGNPLKTILYIDHKPLVSFIKSCEPNTLKHQWYYDKFSKLQVDIIYYSGKDNLIVDTLSRVIRKKLLNY